MDAQSKQLLLQRFGAWARERGLAPHRHDAAFHGTLGDTLVEIETGVRDSDLYVAVATIHRACGVAARVLRREETSSDDDPPIVSRLRPAFGLGSWLLSIHIDERMLTLRMLPGSPPKAIGDIVDEVMTATVQALGPYR
jgi:hypothetical protein